MQKQKLKLFLGRLNTKGNQRRLLGLLIVAIVGFIAWAVYDNALKDDRMIYAQAAGHKIYEDELRDFIGNKKNISDHDAAEVLANKYLVKALAEEQGIKVTNKDIKSEYEVDITKQKRSNRYQYQKLVNQIYFDKLANYNKGIYKGKMLVTHFNRFVPYKSALLAESKELEPRIGNKAAIAKDKKYAKNLITRLYKQVQSGKLTFDEAAKIERNDPIVGVEAYPTSSHSGSFDTTVVQNTFMGNELIRQQLGELKPGEIIKPTVIKVINSDDASDNSLAESFFLVIKLKEVSGNSGVSFEQYLKDAKERLEYEINI